MQFRDFPFGFRLLVVITILLCITAGIFVFVSLTAIVALLSDRGVHPAGWTIMGVILGSTITLLINRTFERQREAREARNVAVSLHAELADRASRCMSDFLFPWGLEGQHDDSYKRRQTSDWVAKFRPVDPVVYPAVASKLGLLRPDALYPLVQFYFRLDALRREIDQIISDFDHNEILSKEHFKRLRLVSARFRQCLGPALYALEKLNVDGCEQIEMEAARSYDHARKTGQPLRELLRKHMVNTK